MPKINHPNIGDVQQYTYLQGTATSVDASNDTACINIPDISMEASDVPLFYHCSHDVAERSNGALEGAAAAFTNSDEVIVQCRIIDGARYEAVRVIGFVEGIKSCLWEPWGSTICANHNWAVELYDPWSETLCPSFPFGDWSLSEDSGDYSAHCSLTIPGPTRSTFLTCADTNNPGEMPNATRTPFLKLKVSASTPSNEHYGTFVYLKVVAGGTTKRFWFAYARGDFGQLYFDVFVGDNDGEEMTINLADYGLTGDVTYLAFGVSAENGDTSTLDCDYLTFTETS